MKNKLIIALVMVAALLPAYAKDNSDIKLPAARTSAGKPLMQALAQRQSLREFSAQELEPQVLADLLWAANGINRSNSGQRTAPSAHNSQEIDIYLTDKNGLYLYDAKNNLLSLVCPGDIRALSGEQDFVKVAPVNLIYVADFSRMKTFSASDKELYSAADTGFISQNVYLFCASQGLATVVRGWINKPALSKAMGLKAEQKIILAQTVGYPKK